MRSFTGFVPKIDQSGLVAAHKGITKAGDAGLRQALYMAADHARHLDPTLAQRYYRLVMVEGKHHNSALCSVSAVLITRIAACWRKGELYELRDEDGEAITEAEGKAACADRFKIDPKVRAARRRNTPAKVLKNRAAGRGRKESARKVAPAAGADRSKERQIPTVAQVEALMQAMPAKLRAAVMLASWGTLRRGEVLGLRRDDVGLGAGTVRVERSLGERRNGAVIVGPPKSGAGVRTVHMPPSAMEVLERHLRSFVGAAADVPLFVGCRCAPSASRRPGGAPGRKWGCATSTPHRSVTASSPTPSRRFRSRSQRHRTDRR